MDKVHIDIEIVSDVVCPWCYVGQQRLKLALDEVKDALSADITWKPYQLDPTTPPEGVDAFEYLAKKIGGADAVRRSHEMLTKLGAEIGLPFALEKAKIFPNTLDAHRLIHWAGLIGSEMQDKIVRALFKANFVDGLDVGNRSTLTQIAVDTGMDRRTIEKRLADNTDLETIKAETAHAQRMGISGVPCFIFDHQYAVTGAQPVEAIVNALRQIAEMKISEG
ncbi:MAG: DSBA-like thioredoxin protein [Rhizobium sp.]|nr:DSBA-like thioredoxin protein [Rhizobium sp.]